MIGDIGVAMQKVVGEKELLLKQIGEIEKKVAGLEEQGKKTAVEIAGLKRELADKEKQALFMEEAVGKEKEAKVT